MRTPLFHINPFQLKHWKLLNLFSSFFPHFIHEKLHSGSCSAIPMQPDHLSFVSNFLRPPPHNKCSQISLVLVQPYPHPAATAVRSVWCLFNPTPTLQQLQSDRFGACSTLPQPCSNCSLISLVLVQPYPQPCSNCSLISLVLVQPYPHPEATVV